MAIFEMDIADVLDLPSCDSDHFWKHNPGRKCKDTVRDVLRAHRLGAFHREIREQILTDGINAVPVWVVDSREFVQAYPDAGVPDRYYGMLLLANGHHRIRIMHEAGLTRVRCTDREEQSEAMPDEVSTLAEIDFQNALDTARGL